MAGCYLVYSGILFSVFLTVYASYDNTNGACLTDGCQGDPKTGKDDCGLVGMWKNELDSEMEIERCTDGQISGRYNSKVGEANNWYPLVGRYTATTNPTDGSIGIELGWTVSWNNKEYGNSNSVTTWSGIYHSQIGKIHTQWILTAYVTPANLWESATINHDSFSRVE